MPSEYQKATANTWRWFSRYARLEDADENGWIRCISCSRPKRWDDCDAGHYINRVWTSVKFDKRNVHAQCKFCNRFNEGEQAKYKINLINKIGEREFQLLLLAKGKRKIPIYELNEIKKWCMNKVKELKKVKEIL